MGAPGDRARCGAGLELDPSVTYLIGENGSGKSTLLEALAVAAGMNAEGGSSNFASRRASRIRSCGRRSASCVGHGGREPTSSCVPRACSPPRPTSKGSTATRSPAYGGVSLHEQSHGESFLAVMINRFGPDGLYLLDEPEAALSTQNCLTCLRRIHELVQEGSQFIIATHSPIILAYPARGSTAARPTGSRRSPTRTPSRYGDPEPPRPAIAS